MKRSLVIAGTVAALAAAITVVVLWPNGESKPWRTTDVWYHESNVAQVGRTGRPQLVEFFHPD